MTARWLGQIVRGRPGAVTKLGDGTNKTLKNWNGIEVGQIRPGGELA